MPPDAITQGLFREVETTGGHNLLVVSDLHLGESLGEARISDLRHLLQLTQAFSRFLAYYATERVGGRPWRLVIAGDMIDFVRAGMMAGRGEGEAPGQSAARALERVVEHFPKPFEDLARFVAAGHDLVIIKGNHDVEFHWDEVQARFISLLEELAAEARSEIRARVTFARWFWYEHGLVYIEHGNQYDEFCSFEHVLEPTLADEDQGLEEPISHQTLRAFQKLLLGKIDIHAIDRWKIPDFVRWLSSLGPRLIAQLAYTYFASIAWLVATERRLVRAARVARRVHRRRLGELAQRFRLNEDALAKLDALRQRPAGFKVLAGLQMLYMDRIFLLALTVVLIAVFLIAPFDGLTKLSLVGGSVVGSGSLFALFARLREVESPPKLRRVAHKIQRLMNVRYVVFGHTHVPTVEPIAGDQKGYYINTGSWTGDSAGGLTHLCITSGSAEGPMAELRRWCVETHRPLRLRLARKQGLLARARSIV